MLAARDALGGVIESLSAGGFVSNPQVWRAAQERLRPQMTSAQFDTWLRGTSLALAADGTTVLSVRTTFAKEMLETRFRERVETAIREVTGKPCALRIVVAAGTQVNTEERERAGTPVETRSQLAGSPTGRRVARQGQPETPMHTLFDPATSMAADAAVPPARGGV